MIVANLVAHFTISAATGAHRRSTDGAPLHPVDSARLGTDEAPVVGLLCHVGSGDGADFDQRRCSLPEP
jgi:hypothetical protein